MSVSNTMRGRLKLNRPSLRKTARPPKQRSSLGTDFNAANLPHALALQYCRQCDSVQYPPREVCRNCLGDSLVWRPAAGSGRLLSRVDLHHSLWEYYKRRITQAPWPVASVRLDCGVTVFAHLALDSFEDSAATTLAPDTPVQVFTHTDCSLNAVMIAVSINTPVTDRDQRQAIAVGLGLTEPATKAEGI